MPCSRRKSRDSSEHFSLSFLPASILVKVCEKLTHSHTVQIILYLPDARAKIPGYYVHNILQDR